VRKPCAIEREPDALTYAALIRFARAQGSTFSLTWRPRLTFDANAKQIERALRSSLIRQETTETWPGTQLVGHAALVRFYTLSPDAQAVLDAAARLYAWLAPNRPEDLAFYTHTGRYWLASIAHERDAFIDPGAVDVRQLLASVPDLRLQRPSKCPAAGSAPRRFEPTADDVILSHVEDAMSEWQTATHALGYLEKADGIPHRREGEATLLDELPGTVRRVLDLGSGDGRLLDLVLGARPASVGVAVDFSPPMLERLRQRFEGSERVQIIAHNLDHPLPSLGLFDVVVSSFAIHHVHHERKRELYTEIWNALSPGGVFCNLEHVASASDNGHARFLAAMGRTADDEDPSNQLLDVHTQLVWLREIGFTDVDCYWKWRELALLVGRKANDVRD